MSELWPLPDDPLLPELLADVAGLNLPARYREIDRAPEFPRAELRALGARRWLGLTIPESLGGRGLTPSRAAILLYRLAYASGTTFAKLSLQPEFCSVLAEHGGSELVDAWFRPLVRGERLVGNHVTEPEAGSDAAALGLIAEPVSGGYRLSGAKSEAAFAADAEAAIVYGRRPGTDRTTGVSAFLVPQDLPEVKRAIEPPDLGERWQRRGRVDYGGVEIPGANRIGAEGRGFDYLRAELDRERGLLAAIYLGVARASWEETVRDVGERRAFGRRLSDQQGVALPLVRDGTELESAWRFTQEALVRLERDATAGAGTAAAKALATRVSLTALDHAIQFHGGAGYSSRQPHEQRWRDVRSGGIAHGPTEVLESVVARRLWPRPPRD